MPIKSKLQAKDSEDQQTAKAKYKRGISGESINISHDFEQEDSYRDLELNFPVPGDKSEFGGGDS